MCTALTLWLQQGINRLNKSCHQRREKVPVIGKYIAMKWRDNEFAPVIQYNAKIIPMAQCKKDVTPLLTHWSYVFLAPSHGYHSIIGYTCNISSIHNINSLHNEQLFRHKHIEAWTAWRPGHRDKMAAISQITFLKRIFLNKNVWISFKISLKFVPKGSINNIPSLVQIMTRYR